MFVCMYLCIDSMHLHVDITYLHSCSLSGNNDMTILNDPFSISLLGLVLLELIGPISLLIHSLPFPDRPLGYPLITFVDTTSCPIQQPPCSISFSTPDRTPEPHVFRVPRPASRACRSLEKSQLHTETKPNPTSYKLLYSTT